MLKRFVISMSIIVSTVSAVAIASVGEVDNWWQISSSWLVLFIVATSVGIITGNISEIRRYTYPAIICITAWAYEHNILVTKFARNSNIIFNKHNKDYHKLFQVVQDLYDAVMFVDV